MNEVSVTTGARLHFGPLSVAGPKGGRFGGIGLMIADPRLVLTAKSSDKDHIHGDANVARRIAEFLKRIRESKPAQVHTPCEITIRQTIPAHCGYGSGTQLALAVARLESTLSHEPTPSLETLARRVQRGLRSAIGLHGFEQGGFLVDGGRWEPDQLGTLISRVSFPSEWRFVLAFPRTGSGLSGTAEQAAFAKQPPMSRELTAELCRIVLMDWLPAVIEANFQRCSDAMYAYGHAVGEFFSPTQGGVFAHPRIAEWATTIRRQGIHGVAQTSWGPTIAALCENEQQAQQLAADFRQSSSWSDCSFDVVMPLNHGATMAVS